MRDCTAPYFGSLITASAITARAREREAAADPQLAAALKAEDAAAKKHDEFNE